MINLKNHNIFEGHLWLPWQQAILRYVEMHIKNSSQHFRKSCEVLALKAQSLPNYHLDPVPIPQGFSI